MSSTCYSDSIRGGCGAFQLLVQFQLAVQSLAVSLSLHSTAIAFAISDLLVASAATALIGSHGVDRCE
eukprot:14438098-Alexandrium_andersonii.AAC.1